MTIVQSVFQANSTRIEGLQSYFRVGVQYFRGRNHREISKYQRKPPRLFGSSGSDFNEKTFNESALLCKICLSCFNLEFWSCNLHFLPRVFTQKLSSTILLTMAMDFWSLIIMYGLYTYRRSQYYTSTLLHKYVMKRFSPPFLKQF